MPFSKLKVIDLSTVLAGPSVGTFFSELGADVVKIEHPHHPDVTRSWKLPSEKSDDEQSAYFSSVNYKKKYLSLDLKNEKDYSTFVEMVSGADILLSNFKKGDDVKLNISDSILRALNPGLIHGKITGFGTESDRVAYDLILQAETGFMSMNGTLESGPVKMPVALIDVLAAHHLKEGLLIALLKRSEDQKGRTVSVSLYDAAICSLANQASNYLMENKVAERIGSLHPNIAPYGEQFQTKDNRTITFAIGSDTHFAKLCTFLELTELIQDEKFATNPSRVKNRTTLASLLANVIQSFDCETIVSAMHQNHVPVGEIKSLDKVLSTQEAQELIREEMIEKKLTRRITSVGFTIEED